MKSPVVGVVLKRGICEIYDRLRLVFSPTVFDADNNKHNLTKISLKFGRKICCELTIAAIISTPTRDIHRLRFRHHLALSYLLSSTGPNWRV